MSSERSFGDPGDGRSGDACEARPRSSASRHRDDREVPVRLPRPSAGRGARCGPRIGQRRVARLDEARRRSGPAIRSMHAVARGPRRPESRRVIGGKRLVEEHKPRRRWKSRGSISVVAEPFGFVAAGAGLSRRRDDGEGGSACRASAVRTGAADRVLRISSYMDWKFKKNSAMVLQEFCCRGCDRRSGRRGRLATI